MSAMPAVLCHAHLSFRTLPDPLFPTWILPFNFLQSYPFRFIWWLEYLSLSVSVMSRGEARTMVSTLSTFAEAGE